jgi:hypothetical protein
MIGAGSSKNSSQYFGQSSANPKRLCIGCDSVSVTSQACDCITGFLKARDMLFGYFLLCEKFNKDKCYQLQKTDLN